MLVLELILCDCFVMTNAIPVKASLVNFQGNQLCFVGVQLVIRSVLKVSLINLLNTPHHSCHREFIFIVGYNFGHLFHSPFFLSLSLSLSFSVSLLLSPTNSPIYLSHTLLIPLSPSFPPFLSFHLRLFDL